MRSCRTGLRRSGSMLVGAVTAALMAAACGSATDSSSSDAGATTTVESATTTSATITSEADSTVGSDLVLASSAIGDDGVLPVDYTCDGSSASPTLEWSGAPNGTVAFAIITHHIPPDGEDHWYWTLWDIPADVRSISTDEIPPGEIGTNSVDGRQEYAPPCSQGPGEKTYTLTIYALSANPDLSDPASVGRDELLEAIDGSVLDEAVLDVTYSRDDQGTQP